MEPGYHDHAPWRDLLRPFAKAVLHRLWCGAATYGDRSLEARPAVLLRELSDEASDLACWGYLLWRRVEHLRRRLARATTCPLCGASVTPVLPAREEEVVL